MLHPYAIEPDVLVTWDKCRHTLSLMGFQHGRAIAAYPSWSKWKQMTLRACNASANCGEREFQRIHEKLRDSERKVVRVDGSDDYDGSISPSEECWIRNATARQDAKGTFRAILSTRNPMRHRDVVLEEDIDENDSRLEVPREVSVLREPEPLAAHVRTLVRNSRKLFLVDPHFDPYYPKWRSVVGSCIALAAETVHEESKIEIHTLDTDQKRSFPEFENHCRRHVVPVIGGKIASVRVYRWTRRENTAHDFHARYVLTDRGGYKLDKGLDEEQGVEQLVSLLDDSAWQDLYAMYSSPEGYFDKDNEFTVL